MNLSADLSFESLSRLEGDLREYADSLLEKSEALAAELGRTAAKVAESQCPSSRVSATIGSRETVDGAEVFASGPILAPADGSYEVPLSHILEFGSGIRGDVAYGVKNGYIVNLSGRGEAGWAYPKDDGTGFGFTHGHAASRYMGAGADAARDAVVATAKRVFKS